jgi:single-stranded DNA-binding protein
VVEYGKEGVELAVEGRLTTRFYNSNGKINYITEVEVNDLIVM